MITAIVMRIVEKIRDVAGKQSVMGCNDSLCTSRRLVAPHTRHKLRTVPSLTHTMPIDSHTGSVMMAPDILADRLPILVLPNEDQRLPRVAELSEKVMYT